MGAFFNSSWAALAVYCCKINQWNDFWNYSSTARKNLLLVLFNFSFLLFSLTTWGHGAWVWKVGFIKWEFGMKMAGKAFLAFSVNSTEVAGKGKWPREGRNREEIIRLKCSQDNFLVRTLFLDSATIWNTSRYVLNDRKMKDNGVSFKGLVPITEEQRNITVCWEVAHS